MLNELTPDQRIIVAADFDPWDDQADGGGWRWVREQVLKLADSLAGTRVTLKLNSILREIGYSLIDEINEGYGLKVFADLKLNDIPSTMARDARHLIDHPVSILTVMCSSGITGMRAVMDAFYGHPSPEVLGVTALTTLDEEDCQAIYGCSTKAAVLRFARMAQLCHLNGLVLSPQEAEMLKRHPEVTLSPNTPGIRPEFLVVEGDDQERVMTPRKAIAAGVERVIVGRPVVQADDPRDAILRIFDEVKEGLKDREERES